MRLGIHNKELEEYTISTVACRICLPFFRLYTYMITRLYIYSQAPAFLQLGKQNRKESVAIAVDVAKSLMLVKHITPTFTVSELRDYISNGKCGVRSQSHSFYTLTSDHTWTGDSCAIKVPVVHLDVFPRELALKLGASSYMIFSL